MTSSIGNSIIVNRSFSWSSFTTPSWGEMVIYELHPKTWVDGFTGTGTIFAKVASKAAYLKDSLAVNVVKIMPVAEFAGDYSWGYNPANLFAVESHYGGYSAYKSMVNTLHQNGIAVIQDVVHNHYGPSDLALWCFDGPSLGNGGIYFYTDWRKVTPWGDSRPDYGRGEVRSYIRDNAIYWLEEMGADGLRWDATVYIRKTAYDGSDIPEGWTLLQWVHNEKNARFSWKISIAEDLQGDAWVTKTTGEGGAGFDSQWDPNYLHKMRDELKKGNDGDRNMFTVRDIIGKVDNGNPVKLTKYTESHDECAGNNGKQRLVQDIDTYNARSYWAKKRAGLGLILAVFSPGLPMIWQGQENLETGNWSDSKNFSWDDVTTFAGYVAMIRDANRLKRNWYNTTRGFRGNGINVHHVNNTGKVVAFHRWQSGGAGDDVIVVANFGNTQYASYNIGAPSTGTWYCRYNSDWNGYDAGFGNYGGHNTTAYAGAKDGMGNNMNVALGGYAVLVFSK
jgi:1,4-alpha-glucan branching enzyme